MDLSGAFANKLKKENTKPDWAYFGAHDSEVVTTTSQEGLEERRQCRFDRYRNGWCIAKNVFYGRRETSENERRSANCWAQVRPK